MAQDGSQKTTEAQTTWRDGMTVTKIDGDTRGTTGQSGIALARWAGGVILAVHGLIHLMGVALLWELGQPGELRYAEMSPVPGSVVGLAAGAVWLTSAALFVWAAGLLITHRSRWRTVALVALIVSVPVLGAATSMAAAGLAVDAVILLVVITASGLSRQVPQHHPEQES